MKPEADNAKAEVQPDDEVKEEKKPKTTVNSIKKKNKIIKT